MPQSLVQLVQARGCPLSSTALITSVWWLSLTFRLLFEPNSHWLSQQSANRQLTVHYIWEVAWDLYVLYYLQNRVTKYSTQICCIRNRKIAIVFYTTLEESYGCKWVVFDACPKRVSSLVILLLQNLILQCMDLQGAPLPLP